MKTSIAVLSLLSAAAIAGTANARAPIISTVLVTRVVHIDSGAQSIATQFFQRSDGNTDYGSITALFGASIATADTPFDISFEFSVPVEGSGSGSVSTSYSSDAQKIDISKVIIGGVSYPVPYVAGGESLVVANYFPVLANTLTTIEVFGRTGVKSTGVSFDGTATFTAVPEPATWATFLLGFGLLGFGLRRKRSGQFKTA